MSECFILPVAAILPIAAPAAPAVPIEGEIEGEVSSDPAFMVDEASLEEPADKMAAADLPLTDMPRQDQLQMLIEDLSGITGALREAPAEDPDAQTIAADLPLTDLPRQDRPGMLARDLPGLVAAPSPEPFSALEGSMQPDIGVFMTDSAVDVLPVDVLLADSPLPATVGGKESAPVASHPSSPKIPVASISQQIAEAVVTTREDRIEVVLAPEELGRIRMVMSGSEHNPHVLIWAERPEVLDQLRRNASFLQECFGDAGMADASFEFQGEGSEGWGGRRSLPDGTQQGLELTESVSVPLTWTPLVVPARLDIRI